jgi:hypothetical protein
MPNHLENKFGPIPETLSKRFRDPSTFQKGSNMTARKQSTKTVAKPALKVSPPAATPVEKQKAITAKAGGIQEARFEDGQAEGQLFVKLPGTPAVKHKNEPQPSKNRKGLRAISSQGESYEEMQARIGFSSVYLNSNTAKIFVQTGPHDEPEKNLDTTACAAEMVAKVEAMDRGDTSEIEHQLLSQAVALQAIFGEMARRAALNMGTYIEPTEVYMRLALKAQSQCRATLETLAEIKNPRPVYLNPKQVNNVNGNQQVNNAEGPQQINSGSAAAASSPQAPLALTSQPEPPVLPESLAARAGENKIQANKLLEQA